MEFFRGSRAFQGNAYVPYKLRQMKTAAVVISYNPDQNFAARIKAIAQQCSPVLVVDNGSSPNSLKGVKATIIRLGKNTGIAHAQNVGLKHAFEKGVDGVVLFDHDSVPRQGFTPALWKTYHRLPKPSIIGANILDINQRRYLSYPVSFFYYFTKSKCAHGSDLTGLMMVIASGTLISRSIYDQCGGMKENMFIDYVDWEYCLRARQLGVEIAVSGDAVLEHERGKREGKKIGPFTFYPLGYSPFRYQKIFQNRLLVLKRYGWREPAYLFFELLSFMHEFFLLFIGKNKLKNILSAVRGIKDGILGSLSK